MFTLEKLYEIFKSTSGVSTDTRCIKEGSFYFALKGNNFNGNLFAMEALEKGASFCLVEELHFTHPNIFQIPNVLDMLQRLATFHRKKLRIPIVALTGSNGKTTSKELIASVLSKKYKITVTQGNLNNHIGVPLTLLSMDSDTQMGVVEIGANHQGEIAALSKIVSPDYGYITNFGKAHLEGFGGVQGVIKGKTELYKYLEKSGGKVFVNQNDSIQLEHSKNIQQIFFENDFQLIENQDFVTIKYQDIIFRSNLVGDYNFSNIAAAITIGIYFGVPLPAIQNTIKEYIPNNNRSQIVRKSGHKIILDAYNANPTSVALALENFENMDSENKTVILGDMFELGKESIKEHQNIANLVRGMNVNAYFVGNFYYKTCPENFKKFKTTTNLHSYLKNNPLRKDSLILIKGSRGMALEQVLDWL